MQKELIFKRNTNNCWYIDLPNWIGPKSALLMVGGAHNILEEFASKIGTDILKLKVSTDKIISPYILKRKSYTLTGGAFYDWHSEGDVWLCPVTLFVFSKYPKTISFVPVCTY